MNIPFSILKERKLDQKCFEYHQTLAKRYYNYKLNKSSNQKKPNKYSKKKIYNWFFGNLDIKQKLKVCSIYNDWFIKILEQLLTYNDYDNKIKFKPREIYTNFYKMINNDFDQDYFDYSAFLNKYKNENKEDYFNIFFDIKENDDINQNENKKTYMQKSFLNELVLFSLNKTNDILSLNEELLNNREKLQEYFDQFSNCKIFSENIKVNKEYNNIYNFSLPNWLKDFEEGFSVHQLIIICFEISISIYYQLYGIENALPKFEIDSKIEDLYNMKLNMENYLAKETSNEKNPINSILDYKELDSDINSEENEKIYKEHEAITEYVYKIAFDHNQSSFYTDPSIKNENINNAIISLKIELKNNIPKFVETITFIKANVAFKIQGILYNIIYQKIASLYNNRNLDELCNDINEISKTKKKKKKNKKNKSEKKEENIEEKNININDNNEYNNIDDNKYSINCVENKNNSNNSDEEDDEDNQIFSNDCSNEFNNSNNINSNEENNKECIEMKYLDDKGKEIINLETMIENQSVTDLLEYINYNSKEKKNKKRKKKHKNKNKNNINNQEENNNEIKKEEFEEEKEKEKENNINNNINKTEINLSSNINEKKDSINNIEQNKEENKNKKYK